MCPCEHTRTRTHLPTHVGIGRVHMLLFSRLGARSILLRNVTMRFINFEFIIIVAVIIIDIIRLRRQLRRDNNGLVN